MLYSRADPPMQSTRQQVCSLGEELIAGSLLLRIQYIYIHTCRHLKESGGPWHRALAFDTERTSGAGAGEKDTGKASDTSS